MSEFLTQNNILFIITILSVIFGIFSYFHVPQEALEKKQAITDERMNNNATLLSQQEIDNKADVLAKQVQWEKEANERRFKEMSETMKSTLALAQNHIHTVDTKVDNLAAAVNSMNLNITEKISELSTTVKLRINN